MLTVKHSVTIAVQEILEPCSFWETMSTIWAGIDGVHKCLYIRRNGCVRSHGDIRPVLYCCCPRCSGMSCRPSLGRPRLTNFVSCLLKGTTSQIDQTLQPLSIDLYVQVLSQSPGRGIQRTSLETWGQGDNASLSNASSQPGKRPISNKAQRRMQHKTDHQP